MTLTLRTNLHVLNRLNGADGESLKRLEHYADWLLQLGKGHLPSVEGNLYDDVIALSPGLYVNSEDDVVSHVYDGLEEPSNHTNSEWLASRTILTTTNNMVDLLNNSIIDRLPGEPFIVKSVGSLAEQNLSALYPPEFLN